MPVRSINRSTRPGASKTSKTSKAGAPPTKRSEAAPAADAWEDETPPPRPYSGGSASGSDKGTPTVERHAYFGPGASATDLSQRAPRRNNSLSALDLARPSNRSPMLVPPMSLPWMEKKHPTVDSLIAKATLLGDGRLVDARGHSYLLTTFGRQTLLSSGGMVVSCDLEQPQAYWAKRMAVPAGEPLPDSVRREVELNAMTKDAARVHRILRTDDAFYLLMPHMMGDNANLLKVIDQYQDGLDTAQASEKKNDEPGALSLQLKRHYSAKMLQSVADANAQNIFHRDIKLENFAYHLDSVSLIDFGSAHLGKAEPGAFIASTPHYLAPDHLFVHRHGSAVKADAYAAAVSVYTMFTGDNFFAPITAKVLHYSEAAHHSKEALVAALAEQAGSTVHPLAEAGKNHFAALEHKAAAFGHLVTVRSQALEAQQDAGPNLISAYFAGEQNTDATATTRKALAAAGPPALTAAFETYVASAEAATTARERLARTAEREDTGPLTLVARDYLVAAADAEQAEDELAQRKTNYTVAWPLMQAAANALQAARPTLEGLGGAELQRAVEQVVDLEALTARLSALNPPWGESFPSYLRQDPLGAQAIVNALAPTDKQRTTASAAAAAYKASLPEAAGSAPDMALLQVLAQMNAINIRSTHELAERMAQEAKQRLAAPSPLFDELQLENQPVVDTIEQAIDYIKKLASDDAPRIPVLTDKAGGIKRIRELYVKLM